MYISYGIDILEIKSLPALMNLSQYVENLSYDSSQKIDDSILVADSCC
jgi:hypothetical protein